MAVEIATPGRPARAEGVHAVVAARGGAFRVGRPNRDHGRIVAGRGDGAVGFDTGGVFAEISGRHHDGEASGIGGARGTAQRIGEVALGGIGCQADVEHADVVFLGVVQHPFDAGQRVGQLARAGTVEYLDVVQIGVRRQAGGVRTAKAPTSSGDAGHVRAVAVVVLGEFSADVLDRAFVCRTRSAVRRERARQVYTDGPNPTDVLFRRLADIPD